MPLFGLKNAKRKITSSLVLRKTQSTGNIEDNNNNTMMINSHRKTNSNSDIIIIKKPTQLMDTKSILRSPDQKHTTIIIRPLTPPPLLNPVIEEEQENDENDILLASKLRDITACDMDLLLSLETQARMDCQEEKEKKIQLKQTIVRPSKIKFDLPITPPRSKSPDNNKPQLVNHRQRRWSMPEENNNNNETTVKKGTTTTNTTTTSSRLSRWSRLVKQQQQEEAQNNLKNKNNNSNSNTQQSDTGSHSSSEDDSLLANDDLLPLDNKRIMIGSKVKLFKRPLPIIGTVKYLGQVHFDTGEWLGIELDSRVGNTDGMIDGQRYFTTHLHCGIFVKKEDTIKV